MCSRMCRHMATARNRCLSSPISAQLEALSITSASDGITAHRLPMCCPLMTAMDPEDRLSWLLESLTCSEPSLFCLLTIFRFTFLSLGLTGHITICISLYSTPRKYTLVSLYFTVLKPNAQKWSCLPKLAEQLRDRMRTSASVQSPILILCHPRYSFGEETKGNEESGEDTVR